jgi:hypothetical protein
MGYLMTGINVRLAFVLCKIWMNMLKIIRQVTL